jgi:F420 biosynthesis protein FbiB-like protein
VGDEAFWGLIRGRRSVRRYAVRPVPVDLVDKLLEAAHWAPSAHNRQPWRFVLLNDLALRRRLAESMAASWQADLLADGAGAAAVSRRAAISIERITSAPLAILPCLDLDSLDRYPDPQRQQREWQMGVQSVALACQNLLLAAQHYGLVACWMCAPIFCPDLVQAILDLPPTLEPQALLTIGYPPDDAPRNKERAPLATRVVVR